MSQPKGQKFIWIFVELLKRMKLIQRFSSSKNLKKQCNNCAFLSRCLLFKESWEKRILIFNLAFSSCSMRSPIPGLNFFLIVFEIWRWNSVLSGADSLAISKLGRQEEFRAALLNVRVSSAGCIVNENNSPFPSAAVNLFGRRSRRRTSF